MEIELERTVFRYTRSDYPKKFRIELGTDLETMPLTIPILLWIYLFTDKSIIFVLTDIYRTVPRQNKFHLLCSRFVSIFAKDDKHRKP